MKSTCQGWRKAFGRYGGAKGSRLYASSEEDARSRHQGLVDHVVLGGVCFMHHSPSGQYVDKQIPRTTRIEAIAGLLHRATATAYQQFISTEYLIHATELCQELGGFLLNRVIDAYVGVGSAAVAAYKWVVSKCSRT